MVPSTSSVVRRSRWPRWLAILGSAALVLGLPPSAPAAGAVTDMTDMIELDSGAGYTASASVIVTIVTADGTTPSEVLLANDGAVDDSILVAGTVVAGAAQVPWSLDAAPCPCPDGERTVWAQWRTGDGPWSAPVSDSIVVDRTGPAGSVIIDHGAATMGDPWDWQGHAYTFPMVTLTIEVADAGPDLAPQAWSVSRDGATWDHHPLAAYGTFEVEYDLVGARADEGPYTVWVRFQDGLGNWSAPVSDTIDLQYYAAGRVIVGDGGGYEDSLVVKVRFPVDVMPPEGVKNVWVASDYWGCDNPPYDCNAKKLAWTPGMVISWDMREPDYLGSSRLGYRRVVAWFVSTTGRRSQLAQQGFILDERPPVTGRPRPAFVNNSTVEDTSTASRVTARIRWSAAGTGSPIASSRLQRSMNGGAWRAVSLSSPKATTATVSLAQRQAYRFRSRSLDAAGNWGSWATGATFDVVARQQSSGAITYVGRWRTTRRADASAGSLASATAKGARATMRFTGRGVAVVGPRSPMGGEFDVFVDGRFVKTVYTYGSEYQPRRVLFTTSWSGTAGHTISIVKKYPNPDAAVVLDAILVLR